MITGKNFVGKELSAQGNRTFSTFNPKLNTPTTWQFYEVTEAEINNAAHKAIKAFENYSKFSGKEKALFLREIANQIVALDEELIQTFMLESALPEVRARSERDRTIGQLISFAECLEDGSWVDAVIDTTEPESRQLPKLDIRKVMNPLGPIAVFGASNFPLAFSTAGGDTASILASGCPVVVKSHPMHAGTGELVASAVIKAGEKTGMPDGVFSNLNSSGIEVGKKLVMHPLIKGVAFTGSINGGTEIYRLAANRKEPIPVFAEMGSVNPVIVLPEALNHKSQYWAEKFAGSITLGVGQFCTKPGLILGLKGKALNNFMDHLVKNINDFGSSCMLHPSFYDNYVSTIRLFAQQVNVQILSEFVQEKPTPNHARSVVMTVKGVDFINNPNLHHEVFGPFSLVVQCKDAKELELVVKTLEGQLTGTVLGEVEELYRFKNVINALKEKVGRIVFNGVPTGVEVCPSMHHGGPFPASSDSRYSSVGVTAIYRWVRPVSYQNWPQECLPDALKNENPLNLMRLVNGIHTSRKL